MTQFVSMSTKKHSGDKRGGFVPIGDVAGTLPGVVPRGLAMSAQTRHHFTTLRQVNQLIEASEAEPDLGFMARLLALCSLPRTNPGNRKEFVRRNGPYALYMTVSAGAKLPFGNLPRLLLAWMCTEAVRTQSRELVLGRSLYEFMRKLRYGGSERGGERGSKIKCAGSSVVACRSSTQPTIMRSLCIPSSQTAPNCGGTRRGRTRPRCGRARSDSGKNFLTRSSRTRSRSTCTPLRR